jgi:hypothetical protein
VTNVQLIKVESMPSVMEDPSVIFDGPKGNDESLQSYNVQLSSMATARLIPIQHHRHISTTLVEFLMKEMNDEVTVGRKR